MFNLNIHEIFMSRALELAKAGRGNVSPNPLVGCVLVKNGEIIGEGYHEKFGDSHAEIMAIRNARVDPVDSIAYVNLEPCCIAGKTPPCTNALKENGISEVYIGMLDPNPSVNGKGVQELEKNGILTHVGILEKESNYLNRGFTKWVTKGLPLVIAKVAQSSNGFMGKDSKSSIWITGDASRRHSHELRSKVDAVMIGRQTALVDNPLLTVREVPGNNPMRIVLDTNRTLPLSLKIFNDDSAKNLVMCAKSKFSKSHTHYCNYLPVKEDNNGLSPFHILNSLANEGIVSILIEGGQAVLKSFISEHLIDEIYTYISPLKLEDSELENPLILLEGWNIVKQDDLGEDKLIIFEKGVECLQEL